MSMDRRGFLGLVSLGALGIAARTKPADPEPEEHDTDYRRDGVYVFEGGEWHRVARFDFGAPEPLRPPPHWGDLDLTIADDCPRWFTIEADGARFLVGEK